MNTERKISAALTDAISQRELDNREISYRAACEGIVLLKNNGALPVKPGKIALYGAGASQTVKGGTGSGEVNERHVVSILEGMENAGFEITSRSWIDNFEADTKRSYELWKKGGGLESRIIGRLKEPYQTPCGRLITDDDILESACDTAIYIVSRQAGEGADKKLERGEFSLRQAEVANISKIAEKFKNSILVINSGSYMDIRDLDEKVSAVIWFCQQGMEGGHAFADIISGRVNPSGKLTDSWARQYPDVPFGMEYGYLKGNTSYEEYREGIFVGYRYYDTFGVKPRFPFGYGLSYTQFKTVFVSAGISGRTVSVQAEVKNTGGCAGKEVVQLYASCPVGELSKEYQRLVGFAKTQELQPGESEKLEISFPIDYLESYSFADSGKVLEAGEYVLRLGNSSVDTAPVAVIELDEKAVLSKLAHICPTQTPVTELHASELRPVEKLGKLKRLKLKAADLKTETVEYNAPEVSGSSRCREIINSLNAQEMAQLCVGAGLPGMFCTGGNYAPGTVGRTTDRLVKKGITNINLSDGPAGLRLLKESALSRKGGLRFVKGNYMFKTLGDMPNFILDAVEAKESDTRLYQFASSFPVEPSLAQSWNTALCEAVGSAVSREMEELSISFWLAPALNIHKNPLCGRNFEYISEDPVLTGKIAAAITRGVQSRAGCYATIKHFACNNVEDNRNRSDSRLSERTLREIYLKAFEICVKEAKPRAVMSSYNLINGVYTTESYDLCTRVLRSEWGFDGLVMTDWFSTLPVFAKTDKALKAGTDLFMPGLPSDKLLIMKGFASGEISRDKLKRAAARVLQSVLDSGACEGV